MQTPRKPTIYAIDYGTTNSLLAAANAEQIWTAVPLDRGQHSDGAEVMRSVQLFDGQDWSFGGEAIARYSEGHDPLNRLVRSIKKFLPSPLFTATMIGSRRYLLEELISLFLRELRLRADAYFDTEVTNLVLGRPAVYDLDPEKDRLAMTRMEAAARQAGFTQVTFLPEPVACAYDFKREILTPKNVLIADFGGGTSDFTVLRLSREGFKKNDLLAIGGISVAGDALDGSLMRERIAPHLGSKIVYRKPLSKNDIHLPKSLVAKFCSPAELSFLSRKEVHDSLKSVQRHALNPEDAKRLAVLFELLDQNLGFAVFSEIERVKKALSGAPSEIFNFTIDQTTITEEIRANDFARISADQVLAIMQSLDRVIKDSGLKPADIEIVCCTGGTAKVKAVRAELELRFGPQKLSQYKNFHSVVDGLAHKAQELAAGQ